MILPILLSMLQRKWSCQHHCYCQCHNTNNPASITVTAKTQIILPVLLSMSQHQWSCQHHCYCQCLNTNNSASITVTATTQIILPVLLSLSLPQQKCSCQYFDICLGESVYRSTYPIQMIWNEIGSSPQLRLIGFRGLAAYTFIIIHTVLWKELEYDVRTGECEKVNRDVAITDIRKILNMRN
jgi:hypothetical protein